MKISRVKDIIKDCLLESIAEMAPQMSNTGVGRPEIQKLQQAYNKYPSFIPDVITYENRPQEGGEGFVVVAKKTNENQFVRLSRSLPEEDAKKAADEVKKFHISYIEDGLRKGKWNNNKANLYDAKRSLQLLKSKTGLNEMHYFPTLNIQYYKSENLDIPKLSQKYTLYYKTPDNKFLIAGTAADADVFDYYAYKIENGVNIHNQNLVDKRVYTKPELSPKDSRTIEEWGNKKEVQNRREFEKKNFPMKNPMQGR